MLNDILLIGCAKKHRTMEHTHNEAPQAHSSAELVVQCNHILKQSAELSPRGLLLQQLSKSGSSEVSIFQDRPATLAQLESATAQLAVAFPQMPPEFWSLLGKRIAEKRISGKRLEYAINQVIDNFTYQRLTIADILGEKTDKKYRIYSHNEVLNEMHRTGGTMDDYAKVMIKHYPKPCWVKKFDKVLYNIPDEL